LEVSDLLKEVAFVAVLQLQLGEVIQETIFVHT
jgi:hypothetical protein